MESIQKIKALFDIVGESPLLDSAIEKALLVAESDLNVLVTGESGSGKEKFAKIIHACSLRKHKPYISINCGALPDGTINSELFGHVKGAFTGALTDHKGYFEEVNEGTIFLDEIGDLPLDTQARLLRVLDYGEIFPVGSSKMNKVNVRVVAATNVNLPQAIANGDFRADLYYRLCGIQIQLPALRERKNDIPLLFMKFATEEALRNPQLQKEPIRLTPAAENLLKEYPFPGNVRELKNLAERVSVMERNRVVDVEQLKKYLMPQFEQGLVLSRNNAKSANRDYSQAYGQDAVYKFLFELRRDVDDIQKLLQGLLRNENPFTEKERKLWLNRLNTVERSQSLGESTYAQSILPSATAAASETREIESEDAEVEEISEPSAAEEQGLDIETDEQSERNRIEKALAFYKGRQKDAANKLQISVRTLQRRIEKFGIDVQQYKKK